MEKGETMDVIYIFVVLLLVVIVVLVALLLRRPQPVPILAAGPPALDPSALMEVVRNTIDVQVRQSTQAMFADANAQGEQLHNARSAVMNAEAKNLLDPVSVQMGELRATVTALQTAYEKSRGEAQGINTSLTLRLQELSVITTDLHSVLKSPTARGAWGEQQLRNIVELAGMLPFCDFDEQVTVTNDDVRQRPDLVVRLANAGVIAVDSKVPLAAYLRAQAAKGNEDLYHAELQKHAAAVREHVKVLQAKKYWVQFERAPEFVVMFIPGESMLSDALRSDPTLLSDAMASRVLVGSPVNLLALLLVVSKGWQMFQINEHAGQIAKLGKELHERAGIVMDHVDKIGGSLEGAIKAYNNAVGSIEQRFGPTLRKFAELGVEAPDLTEPRIIEMVPRVLAFSGKPANLAEE